MSVTTEIQPRTLWEWLHGAAPHPFFLLDVRNQEETARWQIEGPSDLSTIRIPYFSFLDDEAQAIAQLPPGLGVAVVVCAKGGSSEYVAQLLRAAGRPAVNLAEGMRGWGELHVPLQVPLEPEDQGRFELWQFNRYGKGCLSYALLAGGEAAIVDPSRFGELYETFVRARGARIVEVLETHVHADHLSGGAQLAARTGARYRVVTGALHSPSAQPMSLLGGEVRIHALVSPGHTPGSVSYLLQDRYLLSGDTLFVQGVGRPDLGGQLEAWGRSLHHTLRTVVAGMEDRVQVLPAHFSSVQEAGPSGVVRGRLGQLRAVSPELAMEHLDEFLAALRSAMKEAPAVYAQIVQANLGLVDPGEQAAEWELGRNECAASTHAQAQAKATPPSR